MNIMNYAERIAKGSITIFLMSILGAVIGYAIRLFFARNLSMNDFGLFYAIFSFIGLFSLFRELGFSSSLTKFISEFYYKNKTREIKSSIIIVISIQFFIALLIFIPLFAFSEYISIFYFKTPDALLPFSIMLISYLMSVFFSL